MNILEYTNQQIYALAHNEPINNFIGAIGLKIEYDNVNTYLSYYSNRDCVINTYDDYIDYLFLWKQSLFINTLPFIKDELKEQFEQTYKKIGAIFSKYQVKDAIQYINDNYEQICADQVVASVTFLFISDKINGIRKEFFVRVAQKQPFVWHRNLKGKIKYLLRNVDIIDILFSQEKFDALIHNMYDLAFANLLVLKKYSVFDDIFNRSVDKILVCMGEMEKEIKQENIFQYRFAYEDFCRFLEQIKSPKLKEKKEKLEQYEALLQKQIAEHGHHFSFEIKGDDIEAHLGKTQPKYEILQLTHTYVQKQNKVIHVLEDLMSNRKKDSALIDIFMGNIRQNEYFSRSAIENLQQSIYVYTSVLSQYLLKEERQQTLFLHIKSAIASICEKLDIDYIDKGFINDIAIIEAAFYNLNSIFCNQQTQEKQIIVQMLCHSLITYTCAFIEKLLREFFIIENKGQIYINPNKITLGDLLGEQNKTMQQVLGYEQLRCLRYFLYMDENEVGENIRNKFAHFNGITPKDFQPNTVFKVLWLMLGIINTLTVNYLMIPSDNNENANEEG